MECPTWYSNHEPTLLEKSRGSRTHTGGKWFNFLSIGGKLWSRQEIMWRKKCQYILESFDLISLKFQLNLWAKIFCRCVFLIEDCIKSLENRLYKLTTCTFVHTLYIIRLITWFRGPINFNHGSYKFRIFGYLWWALVDKFWIYFFVTVLSRNV